MRNQFIQIKTQNFWKTQTQTTNNKCENRSEKHSEQIVLEQNVWKQLWNNKTQTTNNKMRTNVKKQLAAILSKKHKNGPRNLKTAP
jgi:2-succinyl-5-enolpyruvyl-6-hydroxy-3-cyclohexene-1-carboxylate synthase